NRTWGCYTSSPPQRMCRTSQEDSGVQPLAAAFEAAAGQSAAEGRAGAPNRLWKAGEADFSKSQVEKQRVRAESGRCRWGAHDGGGRATDRTSRIAQERDSRHWAVLRARAETMLF